MTHQITIDAAWKLSPLEARFLQTLAAAGGRASRGRPRKTGEKIIDVIVCRTRRKFAAHGVGEIKTHWGRARGLELDANARASLGLAPAADQAPAL